jgi:hypothetical protein
MLRLKLWQTYRIDKGTLQDCQRYGKGLPKEWTLANVHLPISFYIIIFVQHYCTLKYYRIFATLLHKVVFSFSIYISFYRKIIQLKLVHLILFNYEKDIFSCGFFPPISSM